jgi:hypothetical protein
MLGLALRLRQPVLSLPSGQHSWPMKEAGSEADTGKVALVVPEVNAVT